VLRGVLDGDASARLPDHDAQLALVVDPVVLLGDLDRVQRTREGLRELREQRRMLGRSRPVSSMWFV